VATILRAWGRDEGLGDVLLVVSELVTNAVVHALGGAVDLTVSLIDSVVRIEVVDRSTVMPEQHPPTDDGTNGRGLLLVDAVAETWGAELGPSGKRVWAEVG
jgi:anti-sigma regulatory factor (Ser/Thr protein kinase)